jgi:hypothetical protein
MPFSGGGSGLVGRLSRSTGSAGNTGDDKTEKNQAEYERKKLTGRSVSSLPGLPYVHIHVHVVRPRTETQKNSGSLQKTPLRKLGLDNLRQKGTNPS